jgi:hypothetical protein
MGDMPRRVAVALLQPPRWTPPGVSPTAWRLALAEDVVDVLALMIEVDAAVAVPADDRSLLSEVGWPGLRGYALPDLCLGTVFSALAADGYEQAALVAADAPDLPGLLIAKLLRPLTSHPVAAAGTIGGDGLLGASAALPAPGWLPAATLDELTPQTLRRHAPQASDVAAATGWHRLQGPEDLSRLDTRLEGWEATRALLTSG